jgi:hypothetical protein
MSQKKPMMNVPSPYDLSGIKQASKRPDLLRMLTISYSLGGVGVVRKSAAKQKARKK